MMSRGEQITEAYFAFLDRHLADIVSGEVTQMMRISQIAGELCISPQHLSDTIQDYRGRHPGYFYDEKILAQAKRLLSHTKMPIAEIAKRLTYDPSNFSKFFKKLTSETPGQYRNRKNVDTGKNPEKFTMKMTI